jgi:hypothetical protein
MSTATLSPLPEQYLRNADIPTLIHRLQDNESRKLDLVVPTSSIRLVEGSLVIDGQEVVLDADGVTDPNGVYQTAHIVDQNLADLFGIPVRYIRRMRAEKVGLLDVNVNTWAADAEGTSLLRILQGTDENAPGTVGLVRAILSSKYGFRDHLDTVMSFLQGLRAGGLDASNITGIDLSHERLFISVNVPQIAVDAKELVKGYRSPFNGLSGDELPLMNAGLVFTNSEVGRGAFQILPKAVLQVCTNGLTRPVDGFRKVHLGGRLQEGSVNWSTETVDAANAFVQAQVKDAVASFLSEGYLENLRDDLLRDAGVEVTDVVKTIEVVAKKLQYSQDEQDAILADFIKGGQVTSGGVLNSITSVAQRIEDPDRAFEFNNSAIDAMKIAARYAMANA